MLAAGLYGTYDLCMDIRSGTQIRYAEDEYGSPVFAEEARYILKAPLVRVVKKENSAAPPTVESALASLSFSDFSRGEPPMIYDGLSLDEIARPDSLKNEDIAAAIEDTMKAIASVKTTQAQDTAKTEARKFDVSLFSRGKPRTVRRIEADSTLANKDANPR